MLILSVVRHRDNVQGGILESTQLALMINSQHPWNFFRSDLVRPELIQIIIVLLNLAWSKLKLY